MQSMFNKNMLRKTSLLILVLSFIVSFTGVNNVFAQQIQDNDILMSVYPKYPKPGDNVRVSINSYTVNLDKSFIVWSLNGEERSRGIGKKTFSFDLEKTNSQNQVTASIDLVGGITVVKSNTIVASDIDMLWEAVDSYVPPFYRGKALGVQDGSFKIVAIPSILSSGGKVSPNNLSYVWKKDGDGQVGASGFGKNYLIFTKSYLDSENEIEVEASDIEGKVKTGNKIMVTGLKKPKVVLYKKDSKIGFRLNQALSDNYSISEPTTIIAVPYFFSFSNINSEDMAFTWSAGGKQIQPNRNKNEITVIPPKERGGTDISLAVEKANSFYQSVKKRINVDF